MTFRKCLIGIFLATLPLFLGAYARTEAERQVCNTQEVIVLSNGVEMPKVGFGLAGMKGEATRRSVKEHLKRGFKLMDGAESTEWYDDESAGDELSKLKEYKREDVFIVSKVHPVNLEYEKAKISIDKMLERWNHTTYLDLILLHYPECGNWIPNCGDKKGGDWKGAYRALEEAYDQGKVRAIGVSNFEIHQLDELKQIAKVGPHAIQNWMDPFYQNREIVNWANENNVAFTSYSSFGMQWEFNWVKKNLVFESPTLKQMSEELEVPITHIVLAWLLKQDIAVIPRSENPAHIAQNSVFLAPGYANSLLANEHMERIDSLDGLFNADPDDACARAVAEGKCGDDNAGGWCNAACQGLEW